MASSPSSAPSRETYETIPLGCPRCGFEGQIPIKHLDRDFTCPKCKRVFHFQTSGAVPGPRPVAGPDPALAGPVVRKRERPSRLGQWWDNTSRATRMLILGTGGVVSCVLVPVVLIWGYLSLGTAEETVPIEQKLDRLAHALVMQDAAEIRSLTYPGKELSAAVYLQRGRPKRWNAFKSAVPFQVRPTRLFARAEESAYVLTFSNVPGAPGETELLTYWKRDGNLEWHFDPDRSLEFVPKK